VAGASVHTSDADLALVCRVRSRWCALPLAHVHETMRPLPAVPVAGAPPFVRGLAMIRGVPVPVVDAARLLGTHADVPPPEDDHQARFVCLHAGGRPLALAVDAVAGLRRLPAAMQQALPPLLQPAAGDVVAAIGRLDAELLLLLRASCLLPQDAWPCALQAGA
jgi:purine-binding chemotaxis protein CheW